MALYDYRCTTCGKRFEVERPMGIHPTATCPDCGNEAERTIVPSDIVLSGPGFYNTDQKSK